MNKFFKPQDFYHAHWSTVKHTGFILPIDAAIYANAKLELEGKVVYSNTVQHTWHNVNKPYPTEDYKGLIINIERMDKCTHPKEKVFSIYMDVTSAEFKCECGVRVKPSGYEE